MTSEQTADLASKIRAFVISRFPLASSMEVGEETSLLEAGLIDSMGILDLVTFLEETFGIAIADEDLNPENFDSIGALTRFVTSKR